MSPDEGAELVLGGDHQGALPERCGLLEEGLGEDEVGGLHVGLKAGVGVEPVVAVDAVGLGIEAGDEGDVVDIGDGRHHGAADFQETLGANLVDIRGLAGLEVFGVKAVDDDYYDGVVHGGIVAQVGYGASRALGIDHTGRLTRWRIGLVKRERIWTLAWRIEANLQTLARWKGVGIARW